MILIRCCYLVSIKKEENYDDLYQFEEISGEKSLKVYLIKAKLLKLIIFHLVRAYFTLELFFLNKLEISLSNTPLGT